MKKRDDNATLEMLEGAKSIGAGAATIASAGAAIGIGNVFSSSIHSVLFLILVFRDTSGLLLGLDFFAMIFPVGFFMNLVTIAIFSLEAGRLQIGTRLSALTISVGSRFFFFALFLTMRPLVRLAVSFFYLYLFSKVLDTWSFHILSGAGAQLAFSSNTSLEWSGTISSSTAQGPADIEATVPAEVPAQAQAAARLEAQAQAQAQLLAALSPLQREALAQIAEGEIELFARIRLLEAELAYRLPPQLNAGEYEQLVKENLRESAFTVSSYLSAVQNELFDVQVMELKAALQERLFSLLLAESDLPNILEQSPFQNIRSEAFDFIQKKVKHLDSMRYPFQKNLLEGTLRHYLRDINQNGSHSSVYKEFLADFTDP